MSPSADGNGPWAVMMTTFTNRTRSSTGPPSGEGGKAFTWL
jgi:hypothetical protein